MRNGKSILCSVVLLAFGVASAADKFDFVYAWGVVRDEATARAFAEIGVTDVRAQGEQGALAARKYGMRPYCSFTPPGPHPQVLDAAAQRHFDAVNAPELRTTLSREDHAREIDRRRKAANCRFGGEPVEKVDTCLQMIPCFLSDTNCAMAKAQIDRTLMSNPLAEGISFDYIGYVNFRSCECGECKARLTAYLAKRGLDESEANRNLFFREALVGYVNAMVGYAKGRRPGLKITIHLYPVFLPDPLYGSDLTADYIQQTVAWYFPWPDEKISDYTRKVVGATCAPGCVQVPFVGLSATEGRALAFKSPERLDHELRLILKSGGRGLGVCNGQDMLKSGYREVFMKYAARGGSR